ncbi:hypothetical protein OG705_07560 [Streptomyces sp. NBC_00838]|uniref:hypothetical protein n=1 Tax=Streptomyces sp. NBC_00838 TaxID=2903680 RepID=UPI00386E0223|nr:hypothetical protein OG705_07560 [Streptomyces sp. NBC_00838]
MPVLGGARDEQRTVLHRSPDLRGDGRAVLPLTDLQHRNAGGVAGEEIGRQVLGLQRIGLARRRSDSAGHECLEKCHAYGGDAFLEAVLGSTEGERILESAHHVGGFLHQVPQRTEPGHVTARNEHLVRCGAAHRAQHGGRGRAGVCAEGRDEIYVHLSGADPVERVPVLFGQDAPIAVIRPAREEDLGLAHVRRRLYEPSRPFAPVVQPSRQVYQPLSPVRRSWKAGT